MVSKRLIHEEGHKRKFLCVIDGTSECDRAVLYAERRATKAGGALALLFVSEPESFQHWIGVEKIMQAEARGEGEAALEKYANGDAKPRSKKAQLKKIDALSAERHGADYPERRAFLASGKDEL